MELDQVVTWGLHLGSCAERMGEGEKRSMCQGLGTEVLRFSLLVEHRKMSLPHCAVAAVKETREMLYPFLSVLRSKSSNSITWEFEILYIYFKIQLAPSLVRLSGRFT